MSSRPATPTDHTTPQPEPETTRRTRSQTRQSQLPDSRRDMIATAQYQSHNPYLPPRHSLQDLHRHDQSSAQPRDLFAPPEFPFDTAYNANAVTSAAFVPSGALEGRREASDEHKSVPYKQSYAQDAAASTRLRHSPSLEESGRQPSSENEQAVEARAAPSKKKRTRTLTTSNQSSVLLALLAKTPFPTTAEREEVGRAIGLTARKVQVWFQNQRQKQKKSGHSGSYSSAPQGATTSAPLPLSRQPGFSASHAARMGIHGLSSPPYSSTTIAPYPGSRDPAETDQYNLSPPLVPAPPRGHITEPYQSSTAYSRSFNEQSSYYPHRSGRVADSEQYQQLSHSNPSGAGQAFTNHLGLSPSSYVPGDFPDPFGNHAPHSREPSTHSLVYPPQSQDPFVSDDQSRPTTSRGSQLYGPSSGDSWRSKPLPSLPSESGRPSTGQSVNWEQNSSEHGFRPPVPPPRSRAFSNPDTTVAEYGTGRTYLPTPITAGLTPSAAFPSSQFYAPTTAPDTITPRSYQALSDYHHHQEARRLRHHTSAGSVGEGYSLRYGDHYTSPGGVSSSSSLSYSEPAGLGLPPGSQNSGSVTYSPVEQRRTRLSYDSSLASGPVLGKRPWTADDGRPTKRARTDDGHASLPLRTSTRALPPSTYQPQPSPLGNQSTTICILPRESTSQFPNQRTITVTITTNNHPQIPRAGSDNLQTHYTLSSKSIASNPLPYKTVSIKFNSPDVSFTFRIY